MNSSLPQNIKAGEKKNFSVNNNISTASATDVAAAMKVDALPASRLLPERRLFEDINQSAEMFIKNFKQELRIQRLESIASYEEMLARGT
ncbi:hypothetical protein DCAR_0518603 [Daucus carota subsp. sativus]|uniref:Uncharacterized protein n=1 Tax=Daucus carota subsp. sativus TaxID=79200 RepID=A0A162A051_DAUCS|nr:hypothetical protein DCAR_0518603 [Daucus carota subsp. sativus]